MAGATSVIVVSYWSAGTIQACLDALLAADGVDEIIVVDNGSGDDTVARVNALSASTPGSRLRLIGNPDNRGFGAACNQGASAADGDVLLFLNPDAFVGDDSVASLRAVLDADPAIGLAGCRIVDEHGRPSGPQRRRDPTWRRSLASLSGLARFERRWPALAGVEMPPPSSGDADDADGVEPVDAVNGSAMMLPANLFRELGGFDEGFRLHAEDLDLCRRVRAAGRSVVYAVAVVITHIGGVSSRRRPFWVEWQKTRSLWRYFRKHDRAACNPLVMALVAIGLCLRFLARMPVLAMARART